MMVQYYEAMAMAPRAPLVDGITPLEAWHKTAWSLFAQSAPALEDNADRPFVFRVQPHPTLPMDVYLLRATQPFGAAQRRMLTLSEGVELPVSWLHIPSRSRPAVPHGEGPASGRPRGKRYVPSISEWPALCRDKLARHGLTVSGDIAVTPHGPFKGPRQDRTLISAAHCKATVQVRDPLLAAEAWLAGVSRMRGYGMGMLVPAQGGMTA